MIKLSLFKGDAEHGPSAIPLFSPADSIFEKLASPTLQPDVVRYIEALKPRADAQYVLVNAMGASEYFGSNINGDAFTEASLIHKPDDWTGNPLLDKLKAKDWPYGFPTFYNAHPFAHHRNKNPAQAFGEVELAVWNDGMKRVELVTRVDKELCQQFGGIPVWDKLKEGQYPDVSMGTKVPFDTCSICLDWDLYRQALAEFKPGQHKHPGEAVLQFHKNKENIRGLSITRADYCEHAKSQMNHIFPDGRKVFVFNDFPRFFDISFVFIGADKTAKVMLKIADSGSRVFFLPAAEAAEKLGYVDEQEKTASVNEDELKLAFLGKRAMPKKGEITKDVVPSQFTGKAIPLLTRDEPDLPQKTLDALAHQPLERALSTTAGLGMVLRPREFQRITVIQIGRGDLADGPPFPATSEEEPINLSSEAFHPILAQLLLPFMASRSALGPIIEKRVVFASGEPAKSSIAPSSHPSELLRKIGAAYNGYRRALMDHIAHSPVFLKKTAFVSAGMMKLADTPVDELFTPLSFAYLKEAFFDEIPIGNTGGVVVHMNQTHAGV